MAIVYQLIGYSKTLDPLGTITIAPEWSTKFEAVQNKSAHRTKSGKLYSYKWGNFNRYEIPIEYLSSSQSSVINSWWAADAYVVLVRYWEGSYDFSQSCRMVNASAPMDELPKPYYHYRSGRIELETY